MLSLQGCSVCQHFAPETHIKSLPQTIHVAVFNTLQAHQDQDGFKTRTFAQNYPQLNIRRSPLSNLINF
jgi:hypothetical protein